MANSRTRIAVIGGGIAGISTAAELADQFDVTVVEQEFQPGYHSTGRSAAVLHLAFENDVVHRLSCMAERFYREPPSGFARLADEIVHVAFDTHDQRALVQSFVEDWQERCPWLRLLSKSELRELAPLLEERFDAGAVDTRSLKLHVDAILQGYRALFSSRGGTLTGSRRVIAIERRADGWRLAFERGDALDADILVNAAGAWADAVAAMAGIRALELQPRRRTGVIVAPGVNCADHPMCYRASGGIYFKPEGVNLMVSPADAVDSPPCDAQPEDLDVAIVLNTLNECTKLEIERPVSAWAGLRSFVADGCPVIGLDPLDDQFFWVAALGGFGIQTAPAYSKIAASMLKDPDAPAMGLMTANELSPARLSAGS